MSLLTETIKDITSQRRVNDESCYTLDNILFIGSSDGKYAMSWEQFTKVADFEYDYGFGSAEVCTDLVILMNDHGIFYRGEYDGSEWWGYKSAPKHISNPKPIHTLKIANYNEDIESMNK